jgi:hypothetical protein
MPLRPAPAQRAHEQVRRREDRPGERDEGRNRHQRDDDDRDQCETRHEQEEQRPEKDGDGSPFRRVAHESTTLCLDCGAYGMAAASRSGGRPRIGQHASLTG